MDSRQGIKLLDSLIVITAFFVVDAEPDKQTASASMHDVVTRTPLYRPDAAHATRDEGLMMPDLPKDAYMALCFNDSVDSDSAF